MSMFRRSVYEHSILVRVNEQKKKQEERNVTTPALGQSGWLMERYFIFAIGFPEWSMIICHFLSARRDYLRLHNAVVLVWSAFVRTRRNLDHDFHHVIITLFCTAHVWKPSRNGARSPVLSGWYTLLLLKFLHESSQVTAFNYHNTRVSGLCFFLRYFFPFLVLVS